MMSSLSENLGKGQGYVNPHFSFFEKHVRHCERSEAIQSRAPIERAEPISKRGFWIASSLALLAMTATKKGAAAFAGRPLPSTHRALLRRVLQHRGPARDFLFHEAAEPVAAAFRLGRQNCAE